MGRYHFGYHDWPLTGDGCPVCQERDDRIGEEGAIAAAEIEEETVHEYVVTHVEGSGADAAHVGQSLYAKEHEGEERTWEIVALDTGEHRGSITGRHKRKTTRGAVRREAEDSRG